MQKDGNEGTIERRHGQENGSMPQLTSRQGWKKAPKTAMNRCRIRKRFLLDGVKRANCTHAAGTHTALKDSNPVQPAGAQPGN